jgi:hypothetical protein
MVCHHEQNYSRGEVKIQVPGSGKMKASSSLLSFDSRILKKCYIAWRF